jgi:hypothetical protein
VVFRSKTWADRLESNIQLQESVMQAWRELSEENDDPNFKIEVEWEKRDWPKPSTSRTSRLKRLLRGRFCSGIARHRINTKVIEENWDDMLRLAG